MSTSTQQEMRCELESWRDLRGKVVMVTGASSGLGWEFCIDLAKAGCMILAAARRTDRLKALCDIINNSEEIIYDGKTDISEAQNDGVRAVAVELDVTADGPTIGACVQKAWNAFGGIDALINNAGVTGPTQSPLDLSEEAWDKTFNSNVKGSWLVSKYVCKQMLASNKEGSVINISSIFGLDRTHSLGSVAYSSSKSSVLTMTKVMALELGKHGIRVNSIAPGLFKSEITQGLLQKSWTKKLMLKMVPLKDIGTIDPALTSLVRYLIHSSSGYVSGNIFIVDAGTSLPGVPVFSSL